MAQAKQIKELHSQLGSADSVRENLVTELEAAKSEVKATKADAEVVVAIYRADAEVSQVRAKEVTEASQVRENLVAEHTNHQSRRENLEEIHARDFDLTVEIESAKELEAEARGLAYPNDEGSL